MIIFNVELLGDDARSHGPWATLAGARDALRALRDTGEVLGPVRVEVAPGTYRLVTPVTFGPEDSHTTYAAAGAEVIFDGGIVVAGWSEIVHESRRAWVVDLPEVAKGELNLRSLFVDGVRRPRARRPKFSPDAQGVHKTFRIGEIRFPERRKLFDGDNAFRPIPGDVEAWPSLPHAEVVLLHYWVDTRLTRPQRDPNTGWITFARRSVFNLYESFNPLLARYYIDNLFEALEDPGEWYVDQTSGRLTYLPLPDEDLANVRITIPVVNQFLVIRGEGFNRGGDVGDPYGARLVEGLEFEGFTFRHADWYPPFGQMLAHDQLQSEVQDMPMGSAPQAAAHVPSVIDFIYARNCRLHDNTIELTGFGGVAFGAGCRDCVCTYNGLLDLGGGGVRVGGAELDGPIADRTGHISVEDNTIRRLGRVFLQSIGVLLMHAFDCKVRHNEIANTCYTGISCGWAWGYRETISRNNLIEGNWIHDICEGVLSDNGGIYLLGVQPGTVVRGNRISHVTCADYGGWGIYPDEGSSHLVIEQNWIHDTQSTAVAFHYGRENIVRDNVFVRVGDGMVGVGRGEGHIVASVFHNVMAGPSPALYSAAYRGDIRESILADANLMAFPGGEIPNSTHSDFRTDVPHQVTWDEWRASGQDRLSVVADPGMTETRNNLVFAPDSPALALGFRPYDWSTCGPRPKPMAD